MWSMDTQGNNLLYNIGKNERETIVTAIITQQIF